VFVSYVLCAFCVCMCLWVRLGVLCVCGVCACDFVGVCVKCLCVNM